MPAREDSILTGSHFTVTYPPRSRSGGDCGGRADAAEYPHTQVHVLDLGEATHPTIVLLGGLAVAWFDWQDLSLALARKWRVLVVDRAGAGLSGEAPFPVPSSLSEEAQVVRQVLDATGVERAVIAGHSMGALVAEAFARLFPDRCAGLALLDPACEPWSHEDVAGVGGGADVDGVGPGEDVSGVVSSARVLPAFARYFASGIRAVVASPAGGRVFSAGRKLALRSGLQTARVEDEWRVTRMVFSRRVVREAVVREYFSYDLWLEQLESLRSRRCGFGVDVLVVAARSGVLSSRWVVKVKALAGLLRGEPGGGRVEFKVVDASHMLMRDVPDRLAELLGQAFLP